MRVLILILLSALAGVSGFGLLPGVSRALSVPLDRGVLPTASVITDRDGNRLAWWGPVWRRPLRGDAVPPFLKLAIVATEDHTFYRNPGVDPGGILRAAWDDLRRSRLAEGGSGITQQLARLTYLDARRTLQRKVEEAVLALRLTRHFTKDEILAHYLNAVYFGHGAYGAEAAAETYFARPLAELDAGELALLAGLPQAPSRYDPFVNEAAALTRRRHVLARMVALGFLDQAEAERLAASEPRLACPRWRRGEAPGVANAAVAELRARCPALARAMDRGEPLTIRTTVDLALEEQLERTLGRLPDQERAGVLLDPRDGAILALVGVNGTSLWNRALYGRRPIASLAKPVVVAAALGSRRFTLASVLEDRPMTFPDGRGGYRPENYDHRHVGPIRLRQALVSSNNVVAVSLLDAVGLDRVNDLAVRLGLGPLGRDLTAALGTAAASPLAVARAYGGFANYGLVPTPFLVAEVRGADGTVLYRANPEERRALSPALAYLIADALLSTPRTGTARGQGLEGLAVKTGTGEGQTDAWIVGMTPERVAVLWAHRPSGFARAAAFLLCPLLQRLAAAGALGHVPALWTPPAGVVTVGGESYLAGTVPRPRLAPPEPPPPVPPSPSRPMPVTRDALFRSWLKHFRPSGRGCVKGPKDRATPAPAGRGASTGAARWPSPQG